MTVCACVSVIMTKCVRTVVQVFILCMSVCLWTYFVTAIVSQLCKMEPQYFTGVKNHIKTKFEKGGHGKENQHDNVLCNWSDPITQQSQVLDVIQLLTHVAVK